MDTPATSDGTTALTVESAAALMAGLTSEPEHQDAPETPSTTRTPRTAAAKAPPASDPEEIDDDADDESVDDDGAEDESPDDADGEDADVAEDEEADGEQPPEPRKVRVKVGDEELEVTEEELLKGYSRQADYTRKTQQLAEQRKAAEAEAAAVREARTQYSERLDHLAEIIKAATPAEPDWETLKREYPDEYPGIWIQWQEHAKRTEALEAERARVRQEAEADTSRQRAEHLERERDALLTKLPAWKDKTVAQRELAAIGAFAQEHGISEQEFASLADHRVIVLLDKARKYDLAEKQRPAVKQRIEKVAVAPAGPTRPARPPVSEVTRQKQRLAKTGSLRDAAALFMAIKD